MSYFLKMLLDDEYFLTVEGFPTVVFIQGDCLEVDNRSKKDRSSLSLADILEYRGGFARFLLTANSPVSGLMTELMAKQKKDMKIKKDHSFSVIVMADGVEEFHLKKCLFNLQISDAEKHYFFIVFEQDTLLKSPSDL